MRNLIKILILSTVFIFVSFSCEKDNNFVSKGRIVFYSNAQAILNCGSFDIVVYINNDSLGIISESYIEETQPDCINSNSTFLLEKKTGKYNYTATMDCGQYGEWSGEFEIFTDSCSFVFLDINNCNPKND